MSSRSMVLSAAVVALLAGCSGGGGGSSSSSSSATAGAGGSTGSSVGAAAQPPSGIWLAGDMHQHTNLSPDANIGDDPAMSVRLAEAAGLDFTCLTDHRTFDILLQQAQGALAQTSVVAIPSMEWNGDGHAGVIGIQTPNSFPTSIQGTGAAANASVLSVMDAIHAQGGLFVVNHPSYAGDPWIYTTERADAIEVWNGNWTLRATGAPDGQTIAASAASNGLTAPELSQACQQWRSGGLNRQSVAYWEALLAQGRKIAAVGGGDRHYLVMPGTPTTRVFAASKTQADIIAAIKLGRTCVSRAPDGPMADLSADVDGDGVFETILGGSVPLNRAVTFRAHVLDADGGRVDLVKDGQIVQRWSVTGTDFQIDWQDTATAKSFYRLDVYEPLDMSFPHASTLKSMVLLGGQSWLTNLTSGQGFLGNLLGFAASFLSQVQRAVDAGGPALAWLLFYGDQCGVTMSPVPTKYPSMVFPEAVSRVLNVDMIDDDFARGAITSPIYAE